MLDDKATAAHAAWKAACAETQAAQEANDRFREPADVPFDQRIQAADLRRVNLYAKQRVQDAAFQAMSDALPQAGKHANLTVQQHIALDPHARTEHAAVKVWLKADYGDRWYAAIGRYDVDQRTGERHLGVTWLCDDAVDEAARLNEKWAAYYAARSAA